VEQWAQLPHLLQKDLSCHRELGAWCADVVHCAPSQRAAAARTATPATLRRAPTQACPQSEGRVTSGRSRCHRGR
jgi:hypothetical protein